MLNKVLNLLVIAFFALTLAICVLVGGCDVPIPTATGNVPMKCVAGFTSVSLVLFGGLLLAVVRIVLKTVEAKRFAALSLGIIALVAALIPSPWAVGLCSWEGTALCCSDLADTGASIEELAWCALTMDCHLSALAVWIATALILVCVLVQAVIARDSDATSKVESRPKLFD